MRPYPFLASALLSTLLTLRTTAALAGESCESADALPFPALTTASTTTSVASDATQCGKEDTFAVWYTFQAPIAGHYVFATEQGDGLFDTTIAVYESCDEGSLILCNDDPLDSLAAKLDLHLAADQIVKVRVAGWGATRGAVTLRLDEFGAFARPANDECEDAWVVSQTQTHASSTLNATGTDLSSCGGEDEVDVWYAFVAPEAGQYEFRLTQNMVSAHFVSVMDGCDGTELSCGHLGTSATLAAGEEVAIRVGTNPSVADEFNLVVLPHEQYPAPTNDTHLGAIEVEVPSTNEATTRGATSENMNWGPNCGPFINPGVWYSFTAPDDDIYVFDTNGSELEDTVLAVLEPCDSNGSTVPILLGCDADFGEGLHSRLDGFVEAGTRLCFAVAGHLLSEEGGITFNVSRMGDPPPNDRCEGALTMEIGPPLLGDNFTSKPVDVTTSCPVGNFPLWFTFTAPAEGLYKFDTKESKESSPDIAVYDSCDTEQPIDCSIDPLPTVAAFLQEGQTVYVRASTDVFWRAEMAIRVGPVHDEDEQGGSGGDGGSGGSDGGAPNGGSAAGGGGQGGQGNQGGDGSDDTADDDDGCNCQMAGSSRSPLGVGLVMGLAGILAHRRRTSQCAVKQQL